MLPNQNKNEKGQFIKGHKSYLTKKSKARTSKTMKGKKPKNLDLLHTSLEINEKRKKSLKGKQNSLGYKHTEKAKKKIKEYQQTHSNSGRFQKGRISNRKGVKLTEKTKEKMGKAKLGKLREKANNWKGGLSFEPYSVDWTETLRRSIRERDHYICQLCNQYGKIVHHIDYNKKNNNPDNLITLCLKCHMKTNSNRNYWINYFKKL